ncbi:MAG: alpha/beta hydrolase [Acidimicrobiales bacterium]
MSGGRPILVLHDSAAEAAGAPWRAALTGAGWSGPVLAPDLPGHGETPAPSGGAYELVDAAVHVLPLLSEGNDAAPVVVGVGLHGWAAQLLALGGRASALVLVDGLGGPWADASTRVERGIEGARAIVEDPLAVGPPPSIGLDPRLRHGMAVQTSLAFARRAASAVPVPVLVIESPHSHLSAEDRLDLVGRFKEAELIELPALDPVAVAAAVTAWARSRSTL